jgi:hypothetical protein
MKDSSPSSRPLHLGTLAAGGGFLAGCVTAAVCALPLLAIGLGIGGLGWLTQYLYLRVPASLAAAGLLMLGFHFVYRRGAGCRHPGRQRLAKMMLWASTVFAVGINTFEFLILPNLG